jgi:leucine-rich repeat/coiled-coil domain-containing protein 1
MLRDLRELNLSSNHISQIDGLQTLTALTGLNLASNRLTRVDNLHHLISLQNLNLAYNALAHLSGISGLQVQNSCMRCVNSTAKLTDSGYRQNSALMLVCQAKKHPTS